MNQAFVALQANTQDTLVNLTEHLWDFMCEYLTMSELEDQIPHLAWQIFYINKLLGVLEACF